jgi:hypothetical protein
VMGGQSVPAPGQGGAQPADGDVPERRAAGGAGRASRPAA